MLDSLFELGQLVSLLGLASGFLLTIYYGKSGDETRPHQSAITDISPLVLRG